MINSAASRILAAIVTALTAFAIIFSLWHFWSFSSGTFLSDFRAFYCAGHLAREGIDPYRQEPLYGCEATAPSNLLWRATGQVTDPAPLPPYALAIFVPIALLPISVAAVVWTIILACAWILVAVACRTLTKHSWLICFASIAFAAMMSLSLGQISPLAIAAVCCAALALTNGREGWAGVFAALAMIEPHVALPVCIALFVGVPRSRIGLGIVAAGLLALTLAFGMGRNLEYLLQVLPTHEISDVADVGQYSTTVLAHVVGFSDNIAARAGTVWYALLAALGIVTAFALRARTGNRAVVALIPMAFAVFGGPYVHWQQVVGAIPAALLLYRLSSSRSKIVAAAVVSLAIPWLYVVGWAPLIPGATAIAALLIWALFKPTIYVQAVATATILLALTFATLALPHGHSTAAFIAPVKPSDLADLSWGAYVRARIPIGHDTFFWLHFPTWAGLLAVVSTAIRIGARPPNPKQVKSRQSV
ncbi:MAG TPA: glycosyltransferase family 87 protein [Candidatus Tumulicola sp.]